MEKPNYRLGKIGRILEGSILAAVNLGNSKRNMGDKTFCFTHCSCDSECESDTPKSCTCNTECRCDKECHHCRCDDYCQDYVSCACVDDKSEHCYLNDDCSYVNAETTCGRNT